MKNEVLYELKALYRDNMRVNCRRFGKGKKSAVIAAGIRGNEIQQIFTCGMLVKRLQEMEKAGRIVDGHSILVIPSINPYSVNVEKRFWPTDNTDINRMFPGYNLGETTQRIAAGVFEGAMGYEYGIFLASNYIPGKFVPHIRIMDTGWDYTQDALDFGLPYVVKRKPRPYDTTTLHYNWQIWETKAFSLFTNQTDTIDVNGAQDAVTSILNFLSNKGIIRFKGHKGYISSVISEDEMIPVKSKAAGLVNIIADTSQAVEKGQLLAEILDPFDCSVKAEIKAPAHGRIFFKQMKSLAYENAVLFRIIPIEQD